MHLWWNQKINSMQSSIYMEFRFESKTISRKFWTMHTKTWQLRDFWKKFSWLLLLNYKIFVIPTYYNWKDQKPEKKEDLQINYLCSSRHILIFWKMNPELFLWNSLVWNGETTTFRNSDVIHLKIKYSINEYME